MNARLCRSAATAAVLAAAVAPGAAAAATPTNVDQLIVFHDGSSLAKRVDARAATVTVGSRRCAVPARTGMAALVRSKPPGLRLRDFGSCSRHARDAAGLFVSRIGSDRNHGQDGWVWKVGNKLATTGAADPSGPFGRGLLRSGASVTWFYCRLNPSTGSCQRTLSVKPVANGAGSLSVTVRSYDDRGHAKLVSGATVTAGSATAQTDASGVARFTALAPGALKVFATAPKAIRSHSAAVTVS
ncbi:MAG: hypothetical protein QOE08_1391 [Thermoleophilaceae bacterium]|nr:hypothetical protein [Thermoleophilaceae bacterium]